MPLFRSTAFFLFQVLTVVPYGIACVLLAFMPLHWRYRFTAGWPRLAIWGARTICGIRWQVVGAEHLPDGPAILLAKHQSAWETMFLFSHMPRDLCFVFKRELLLIPFFGWGLGLLRMIHIDRSRGGNAFESVVQQGSQCLAEGRWIIMFPEGTRIPVGRQGKYKSGGARLAVRIGATVVPIAHNAGECWPRKAFLKKPGLVTVSIGPPIDPQGLTAEDLNARVEMWIEGEMRRLNPERYAVAA